MNLLISKYVHEDVEYPEAVFKIKKIITANVDYEFIPNTANVDDNGDVRLEWKNREHSTAVVSIWPDKLAYEHRANPLNYIPVEFEYNEDLGIGIYAQALDTLKNILDLE